MSDYIDFKCGSGPAATHATPATVAMKSSNSSESSDGNNSKIDEIGVIATILGHGFAAEVQYAWQSLTQCQMRSIPDAAARAAGRMPLASLEQVIAWRDIWLKLINDAKAASNAG